MLTQGHPEADDPPFGSPLRGPTAVKHVRIIHDGEALEVGPLTVTAHFTPGHTPGGTSWIWKSCEESQCLNIVYAGSLSAVSSEGFSFSRSATYPNVLKDFARSFDVLRALPSDILLTAHPEFSDVMGRLHEREVGHANAFIDPSVCRQYVEASRTGLQQRLAQEVT